MQLTFRHKILSVLVVIALIVIFVPPMLHLHKHQSMKRENLAIDLPERPMIPDDIKEFKPMQVAMPQVLTSKTTATDESDVNLEAWSIQLASFSQKANAEDLVAKLKQQGFPAYAKPIKTSKGVVTRVLIGPEINKAKAQQVVVELHEKLKLKGVVVAYQPTKT